MRKSIILIFVGVLMISMSLVSAQVKPNVIVSGYSVKEGAAEVGKDFTLLVTLSNIEPGACARTVSATVQASSPFILNGVSTIPAGDICSNQTVTISIPMKIDPTATGGFYQLTINTNYETTLLAQYSS